jgi:hypothetical protein
MRGMAGASVNANTQADTANAVAKTRNPMTIIIV